MKKIGILVLMVFSIVWVWGADYGAIYIINKDAAQTANATADSWKNISNYSQMIEPSGCSISTDGITTGTDVGTKQYLVRYSLSFKGSALLWSIGVKVGADTPRGIVNRRISSTSDFGNASGSFIATIPQNTKISLQIQTSSASASFTPVHSQLVVVELEQNATPCFAEMNLFNESSTFNPTAWTTITGYTAGDLSGWTGGGSILTAGSSSGGSYLVTLSCSFNGTTSTGYEVGVSLKGKKPYGDTDDTNIVIKRSIGASNDIGNACAAGVISIGNNETIRVQALSSGVFYPKYSTITLVKLGGTSSSTYGSAKIVSNTTATTLPQDTWSKVTLYSSDLNEDKWQYDTTNKWLEPVPASLSAGKYLVNYYVTLEVPLGSDSNKSYDATISLFNNGVQLNDLTIKRRLEKKISGNPDVAAASGTGIITINNPSDALYLQIYQSDKTGVDVTVKNSAISLHRIATINDGALPVTLSNFSVAYIGSVPIIAWTTQSESGNAGWNIYRGDSPEALQNGDAFLVNGSLINGAGTTSEPTNYTFTDEYVYSTNTSYYYWLESVSISGVTENHGPVQLYIPNNNPGSPAVPTAFGLYQNYPNPFNPTTAISFSVPSTTRATLTIYNQTGAKVTTLFQGIVPAKEVQTLTWDGTDSFGKEVASGIYLYKLQTEKDTFTRRMMLIK